MTPRGPIVTRPLYKELVWGGRRIADTYGRDVGVVRCGESWELYDRPGASSVIAGGPCDGKTISQLLQDRGADLAGTAWKGGPFPLMVKIIDARERLSLQVHPSSEEQGGQPKTEMWYSLGDAPSQVFAGLKSGTDSESLKRAIAAGRAEDVLVRMSLVAGDSVFIPSGMIHAIDAGSLLLEIQQNSDTTYRLHDWGRLGQDGKPRELHVNKAIAATKWSLPPAKAMPGQKSHDVDRLRPLVSCPEFVVGALSITRPFQFIRDSRTCRVLFVVRGPVEFSADSMTSVFAAGTTILVPACCGDIGLNPVHARAAVVVSSLV